MISFSAISTSPYTTQLFNRSLGLITPKANQPKPQPSLFAVQPKDTIHIQFGKTQQKALNDLKKNTPT